MVEQNGSTSENYEYISGFAEYEDFGLYKKGNAPYSKAWIKLKRKEIGDYKVPLQRYKSEKSHPFAKRAWIYGKNHIPKHVFKGRTDDSDPIIKQLTTALGSITELMTMIKSMQSKLIEREFARAVKTGKTFSAV
ncbi:MAG: hypothetical protein U5L09_15050 [Bacteroidales bacterium]|nr:hypothetical protein [Bacteroidales bacterium]